MGVKPSNKQRVFREMPNAGTNLSNTYRGKIYTATIVDAPNLPRGKGVKLGGVVYQSLTAAANSITHGSVNGWYFWNLISK